MFDKSGYLWFDIRGFSCVFNTLCIQRIAERLHICVFETFTTAAKHEQALVITAHSLTSTTVEWIREVA